MAMDSSKVRKMKKNIKVLKIEISRVISYALEANYYANLVVTTFHATR